MSSTDNQWIFTEEELHRTPSALEGMSLDEEREKRGKGCNFIVQVGIALKLPQLTLATASTFLHRFYMRHSVQRHHYYDTGATALYLATKVEENMRKFEQLITECVRVAQKNPNLVVDRESKEFWKWRDVIIEKEELLLEAICFDMTTVQPYTLLMELTTVLKFETKNLLRVAWTFVNDSYMTMLCLLFPSRTIAAAALYCAAKHCKVEFEDQDNKPWWEIIGVKIKDIKRACNYMASVYENNPLRSEKDLRYVRTPETGSEHHATRARQSHSALESPEYASSIDGSRGSSMETGGSIKRVRDGSEEGEEVVSTPMKKPRVDEAQRRSWSKERERDKDRERERGERSGKEPGANGNGRDKSTTVKDEKEAPNGVPTRTNGGTLPKIGSVSSSHDSKKSKPLLSQPSDTGNGDLDLSEGEVA